MTVSLWHLWAVNHSFLPDDQGQTTGKPQQEPRDVGVHRTSPGNAGGVEQKFALPPGSGPCLAHCLASIPGPEPLVIALASLPKCSRNSLPPISPTTPVHTPPAPSTLCIHPRSAPCFLHSSCCPPLRKPFAVFHGIQLKAQAFVGAHQAHALPPRPTLPASLCLSLSPDSSHFGLPSVS